MTDIQDLSIDQLQAKKAAMEQAMDERQSKSIHPKFEKMEFPPHGDTFMQLYKQVCAELNKRIS